MLVGNSAGYPNVCVFFFYFSRMLLKALSRYKSVLFQPGRIRPLCKSVLIRQEKLA